MKRLFHAALLAIAATPAGAAVLSSGTTAENFGKRFEVAWTLTYFGESPAQVEQTGCQKFRSERDEADFCLYTINISPVEVSARENPSGEIDYIYVYAETDNAARIASMIEVSTVAAILFGASEKEAVELQERLRTAALRGEAFQVEGESYRYAFKTENARAFYSTFTAR